MAKINDTTTFPNTAPALGDHVPGTDISNTGNDAAGETVTFTMQAVMDLFEANMTVPTSVSSAYRTSTILSSTSNAEGAALIGVEDAGTYFAGATVEAVLAEVGALLPAEANADVTDETNVLAALSGATLTEVDPAATDKILILDADDTFAIKNITWSDVTGLSSTPEGTAILSGGPVTDGYVLTADGAGGAAWEAATGGGNVSNVSTPLDNQIAVWTAATTIEGTSGLTYTGSVLEFTGGLLLNERADHAATPGAAKAELWVSNDTTQKLYMTDDAGTDKEVAFVTGGTDLSAYTGVLGLNSGTAVDVNSKALLEARIGSVDLALATGDIYAGSHDFGGADDLEIPNGAAPTVDTDGQIAIDTTVTDWSHGILEYFSGEAMGVVAMPIAQFTSPTGGYVVAYNATNDEFELVSQAGGGDMSAATYDPATIAEQLVGLTATQTLTNKTLTAPVLGSTVTGTYTLGGTPTFPSTLSMSGGASVVRSGAHALTLTTTGTTDVTFPTTGTLATTAVTALGSLASIQGHTFTLTGDFIRSGAHSLTLTTGATTNVTLPASGTLAVLGANEFTGTQDFNGQQIEAYLNKVVTSVTGSLTTTAHAGNILVTSGNVTVPTTAGFSCILIAGGAHTVTFNGTTSAAMAAGDIMTVAVESGTVIHAVLTAAADKVSFT